MWVTQTTCFAASSSCGLSEACTLNGLEIVVLNFPPGDDEVDILLVPPRLSSPSRRRKDEKGEWGLHDERWQILERFPETDAWLDTELSARKRGERGCGKRRGVTGGTMEEKERVCCADAIAAVTMRVMTQSNPKSATRDRRVHTDEASSSSRLVSSVLRKVQSDSLTQSNLHTA